MWSASQILDVLDSCCETFTFPMLDNGYVYLAATRLSLHRSPTYWALVIEIFGFSPRGGLPDVHVHTFGSRLHNRNEAAAYVTAEAYQNYLRTNPHNESRFFFPVGEGPWQDPDSSEYVTEGATEVPLRDGIVTVPSAADLRTHGIELEEPPRVQTFELCRFLAAVHCTAVLATPVERRVSVPPDLRELMTLEEWKHPDVADDERPSESETFQQLADVLASDEASRYRPSAGANTHWSNWREGGTL